MQEQLEFPEVIVDDMLLRDKLDPDLELNIVDGENMLKHGLDVPDSIEYLELCHMRLLPLLLDQ